MLVRALRAFVAVHRLGTVSSAAEHVHLSQAAVSVQLKNLEQELGVELFERGPRSLTFTPAGEQMVVLAQQMLATYEHMKALADRGGAAQLTLGAIESIASGMLPRALRQLAQQLPGLQVKVVSGTSAELQSQLDAGGLDAIAVAQSARALGDHLVVHPLYAEPLAVVVPLQFRGQDLQAALASGPYIAVDRRTWTGQLIEEQCRRRGIVPRAALEFDSIDAIAAAVRQGLGVAILPLVRGASWRGDPSLRFLRLEGMKRQLVLLEARQHPRAGLCRHLRAAFAGVEDETDA